MTEAEPGVDCIVKAQMLELIYGKAERELEHLSVIVESLLSPGGISDDQKREIGGLEERIAKVLSCSCECAFESARIMCTCKSMIEEQFERIECGR